MGSWWAQRFGPECEKSLVSRRRLEFCRIRTGTTTWSWYWLPLINGYAPPWKTGSCCTNMDASISQLAPRKQYWWPQRNRIHRQMLFWRGSLSDWLAQFYIIYDKTLYDTMATTLTQCNSQKGHIKEGRIKEVCCSLPKALYKRLRWTRQVSRTEFAILLERQALCT